MRKKNKKSFILLARFLIVKFPKIKINKKKGSPILDGTLILCQLEMMNTAFIDILLKK
jgi:hypothetical protein